MQTAILGFPTQNIEPKAKATSPAVRCVMLLLLCCLLTGCSRFDVLNSLVPSTGYRLTRNVAYGRLPRQQLDIYQPDHAKPRSRIVIFFYGGYWSYGKKADYRFVGQALSSAGFIAVLPDYRLYPTVTFPGFVQDGALAVRWVHDHADQIGGDPKHVYLMGHSAGAHIAAMLTLDGKYLKAVGLDRSAIAGTAGLAGPYDFRLGPDTDPIFNVHSTTQPVDRGFEPIEWVDGHEPPMLLLQGDADTTVDPANATKLAARIEKKGGAVKLIIYSGRGHEGIVLALAAHFRWLSPVLADVTRFFNQS
jgi:acetyl esterase/lipase